MRHLEVGVVNHVCPVLIGALIGIRDVSWMSQVEGGIYKQVDYHVRSWKRERKKVPCSYRLLWLFSDVYINMYLVTIRPPLFCVCIHVCSGELCCVCVCVCVCVWWRALLCVC